MTKLSEKIWNILCFTSILGIWPRFVEPYTLKRTKLELALAGLDRSLDGLRIVQFSDLHLHDGVPDFFIKKISNKIMEFSPDIIVFTGDFVCYSNIPDRLKKFLNSISAPMGCFAIFGNHDYASSLSVQPNGDYDIVESAPGNVRKSLQRLFKLPPTRRKITARAANVATHKELTELLLETPFQLLDNTTKVIEGKLNLCGLGEYMAGKCLPEKAFQGYEKSLPGIVLVHNPDGIVKLTNYPGEVILCGHTHGAQVNLPWFSKRFLLTENPKFKRGLIQDNKKWVYVNRGVGSTMPFRFFSFPEILQLTLRCQE